MTGFINLERDSFYEEGISPRQRRVFLLRWNPSISPFKKEDFELLMSKYKSIHPTNDEDDYMDWSVWDWDQISHRDLFVMVQVGQETNGIIWSGFLDGEPYQYEYENGKMSKSHYCELTIQFMHRIEKTSLLTIDKLTKAIPEIDWLKGHSGELLSVESAEKIGLLMFKELCRIKENNDIFFDSYNKQKHVLCDILTYMCPKLKTRLYVKGKNKDKEITDIHNLMVYFDDENFDKWKDIEEHLYLKKLNDVLM